MTGLEDVNWDVWINLRADFVRPHLKLCDLNPRLGSSEPLLSEKARKSVKGW